MVIVLCKFEKKNYLAIGRAVSFPCLFTPLPFAPSIAHPACWWTVDADRLLDNISDEDGEEIGDDDDLIQKLIKISSILGPCQSLVARSKPF